MPPAGGGARGYARGVEIQVKELMRMQGLLKNLLSEHTGQTVGRITHDFDRDYFMNAVEAVEYGIVDEVLGEPAEEESKEQEEQPEEAGQDG